MNLTRFYCYEISPQKGKDKPESPNGGPVEWNEKIETTLNDLLVETKLSTESPIAFVNRADGDSFRNPARDAFLKLLFDSDLAATKASQTLALRLSNVMDLRSKPFLLVLSAYTKMVDGNQLGRIVVWAFPKDRGFKLSWTEKTAQLNEDELFNISSVIRKAAFFEGTHGDDSFIEGSMLDYQSGTTDLWVEKFLACKLSTSGVYGTLQLATYIAKAFEKIDDVDGREELFNAVIAVRTSPVRRMSCNKFAKNYLDGKTKDIFLASIPTEEKRVTFDFVREEFENRLDFRAFKMKDGVTITAPFGTVGNSLNLTEGNLDYSGVVDVESLRVRRGRR